MSTPAGIARAKAVAAGVVLPRRGSLKAKLLQELDFRDRNLRAHEFSTIALILQGIYAAIILGPDLPREQALKALNLMTKSMEDYEAELFHDRYLPEYDRAQQEISRREKEEELRREEAAKKRREFVESMGAQSDTPVK